MHRKHTPNFSPCVHVPPAHPPLRLFTRIRLQPGLRVPPTPKSRASTCCGWEAASTATSAQLPARAATPATIHCLTARTTTCYTTHSVWWVAPTFLQPTQPGISPVCTLCSHQPLCHNVTTPGPQGWLCVCLLSAVARQTTADHCWALLPAADRCCLPVLVHTPAACG